MKETKYGVYPDSWEELTKYVNEIEEQSNDYSSIAEALTNVTVAMFNYFACKHGMTGFQVGWAGLKFLGVTRGIEAPFGIVDGSKLLYPQYDIHAEVDKWIEQWKPELGKLALKKLEEDNTFTHPDVIKRWQEYSKFAAVEETE